MQGPYRPPSPPPDPELARLAMEGEHRRMQLAAAGQLEQQDAGGGHLRTAIGAYRGSTVKRVVLVILIAGCVLGVLGVTLIAFMGSDVGGYLTPGFGVSFVCIFLMAFIPPVASRSAMAAEQGWMMSLPFQMFDYFEFLSATPQAMRSVAYEITWQDGTRPPDPALLHSIFGAVDPRARLDHADQRGARITGGPISGATGITVNRVPVFRNHRLPAQVHAVVDQVLIPLHRSHPIAKVAIRQGTNHGGFRPG